MGNEKERVAHLACVNDLVNVEKGNLFLAETMADIGLLI